MAIRRTIAEFSDDIATADIADDAVTGGKLANNIAISTTGAITTTGAFTSIGIDDNSDALAMTIFPSENIAIGVATDPNTGSGRKTLQIHSGNEYSYLVLSNSTTGSTVGSQGTSILTCGDNFKILNREPGEIAFATSGTDRMLINSSGKVGIGNTSPGDYELKSGDVAADLVIGNHTGNHGLSILSATNGEGRINFGDNDGTGAYHGQIVYTQSDDGTFTFRNKDDVRLVFGGTFGKIYYTGMGVLADQVQVGIRASDNQIVKQSSSRRYKENIVDSVVDSSKILDIVIRDFDWIGEEVNLTGLIAEEVFEVLPECVILDQVDGEGPLVPEAIKYPTLTAILIDQVQKMETRLIALEAA